MKPCEYFTRYGNNGVPGSCETPATLALIFGPVRPPILVCAKHAEVIESRTPTLGSGRFLPIVEDL